MIQIPSRLRQRPRFQGLPIPFTTLITKTGIPDFKVIDEDNRIFCIDRRHCALCGQSISDKQLVVFVGGENSCTNGKFVDPGCHEDCVVYATKVCPFLTGVSDYHQGINKNAVAVFDVEAVRPKRMGLYYCRGYDAFEAGGSVYIQAWQAVKVDWDLIKTNHAQENNAQERPTIADQQGGQTSEMGSEIAR